MGPRLEANGNDSVAKQAGLPRQPKSAALAVVGPNSRPPISIKPQLTRLVEEAPQGWLHEVRVFGNDKPYHFAAGWVKMPLRVAQRPLGLVNR